MGITPANIRAIMQQHASRLTLYARQFFPSRNVHDAEEVVQEVFCRLVNQPKEPENITGWLYKSVRNGAISLSRSQKRRERRENNYAAIPYFQEDPVNQLDALEITQKIELLDRELREIVTLRIWSDLPFSEIGELLGIPKTTVFRRYEEALETLRQLLS